MVIGIVDDEKSIRGLLSSPLTKSEHMVTEAADGGGGEEGSDGPCFPNTWIDRCLQTDD